MSVKIPENGNIILYTTDDGKSQIALYSRDGRVWLNQNQISDLFATSIPNVSIHISNILKEGELQKLSVVKEYLTTAPDGKSYSVQYYSLEMILAIGFRVHSIRGTQFRQWALRNLSEFLVKGYVIDDERLKRPDGRPDIRVLERYCGPAYRLPKQTVVARFWFYQQRRNGKNRQGTI